MQTLPLDLKFQIFNFLPNDDLFLNLCFKNKEIYKRKKEKILYCEYKYSEILKSIKMKNNRIIDPFNEFTISNIKFDGTVNEIQDIGVPYLFTKACKAGYNLVKILITRNSNNIYKLVQQKDYAKNNYLNYQNHLTQIPKSVKTINFGENFFEPIEMLPIHVKHIKCARFSYLWYKMPDHIETIEIIPYIAKSYEWIDEKYMIDSLPKSIKKLILPNHIYDLLDGYFNIIPESVETLHIIVKDDRDLIIKDHIKKLIVTESEGLIGSRKCLNKDDLINNKNLDYLEINGEIFINKYANN